MLDSGLAAGQDARRDWHPRAPRSADYALHGLAQIRDEDLGRRQIETADRLVVTKVDAAEPERLRRLIATLRTLNPGATVSGSVMGSPTDLPDASGVDPETLPTAGGSGRRR